MPQSLKECSLAAIDNTIFAAWFGVNGGRIADIATQKTFPEVKPVAGDVLPPPGPYLTGRAADDALKALETVAGEVKAALDLVREQGSADAAIYALEETEKAVEVVLKLMRDARRGSGLTMRRQSKSSRCTSTGTCSDATRASVAPGKALQLIDGAHFS